MKKKMKKKIMFTFLSKYENSSFTDHWTEVNLHKYNVDLEKTCLISRNK